jgi:hypothetical protein
MLSGKWSKKNAYNPPPTKQTNGQYWIDSSGSTVSFGSGGIYINSEKERQRALFNRMSAAITKVDSKYFLGLELTGAYEVAKRELDEMNLVTIEDIEKWESGWLKLIADIQCNAKVAAKEVANDV